MKKKTLSMKKLYQLTSDFLQEKYINEQVSQYEVQEYLQVLKDYLSWPMMKSYPKPMVYQSNF